MSGHPQKALARAEQHWIRCKQARMQWERTLDPDNAGERAALDRLLADEAKAMADIEWIERQMLESARKGKLV